MSVQFRRIRGRIVPIRSNDGEVPRRRAAPAKSAGPGKALAAAAGIVLGAVGFGLLAKRKGLSSAVSAAATASDIAETVTKPKNARRLSSAYDFVRKNGGYFFGPKGSVRIFKP